MSQSISLELSDNIYRGNFFLNLGKSYPLKSDPPDSVLEWSVEIGAHLYQALERCYYPYRKCVFKMEEPYFSSFKSFLCSLDGYIESTNPVISANEIISRTCLEGPNFAKYLKRCRRKSLIKTWSGTLLEPDEESENVIAYQIKDVGDIFNYLYLPNFRPEDELDYLVGMTPCYISKEVQDEFYEAAQQILQLVENFEVIDPREILISNSGSKSLKTDSNKTAYYFDNIPNKLEFSKKVKFMKRTRINSQPNVWRDSVILEPNDLATVKFIDQQLRCILDKLPSHIHLDSPERINKRIKKFSEKYTWFFMRDIKKEGITKPKPLIKLMLRALKEFTGIEYFYEDFFEDYRLIINDEESIVPIRGHGLGMGNALTTFMQLIIWRMCSQRTDSDGLELTKDNEMLAINDDFVAGFESDEEFEIYFDIERMVMNDLGILTEYNKSWHNVLYFVVAEIYNSDIMNRKESYWRGTFLRSLNCTNIVQAKQIINSTVGSENFEYYENYEKEIISYFGYEFFPEEYKYPAAFGGWHSCKINGVSLDFLELEQLDYNSSVCRSYFACRINKLKHMKVPKKLPKFPYLIIFPFMDFGDKEKQFDICSYYEIYQKYKRLSPDEYYSIWTDLYNRRQEGFKKSPLLPYQELLKEIIKDNPTKTYYPISFMIKRHVRTNLLKGTLKEIYLSKSPKMAYLKSLNKSLDTNEIPESFSINFTEADSVTKKNSNAIRKQLEKSIIPNIKNDIISDWYGIPVFSNPDDEAEFQKCYINPLGICVYSNLVSFTGEVPIIHEEYRSPLIFEKESVFGKILTFEEHKMVQRFSRKIIEKIVYYSLLNQCTIKEFMEAWETQPDQEEEFDFDMEIPYEKESVRGSVTQIFELFDSIMYSTDDFNHLEEPYDKVGRIYSAATTLHNARGSRFIYGESEEEKEKSTLIALRGYTQELDTPENGCSIWRARIIKRLMTEKPSGGSFFDQPDEEDSPGGLFGDDW
jgi:hypothetical protein